MFNDFFDYNAEFVKILGTAHLTYLAICFVIIAVFIKNHKFVKAHKKAFRVLFLCLFSVQQTVMLYGWYFFATPNFMAEGLPLQLCRVASMLTIVYLISGKKKILDPICYFSIFALISLFYPLAVYNFTHISGFSYMINHLITVLLPIYAFITDGWFFSFDGLKRAVLSFTIYFPIALIANYFILGANYFYQTDRPFLHSLPAFVFAALTYVVTVGGFAIITFVLLWLKKLIEKKLYKQKSTEPL